jgi:predicted kinase
MIDTRLILIEGLTGTGKSTTAQRLWRHLRSQGLAARWFYEHDTTHPIFSPEELARIAELGEIPPRFVEETVLRRWRILAENDAAEGRVTVLDGAFFQTAVGVLLAMQVPATAILAHVSDAARAIAAARPALVYLRQGDTARALAEVFADRRADDYAADLVAYIGATPYGKANGISDSAGLLGFYERWTALVESAWDDLPFAKLAIDRSAGDWSAREVRLTDFLGLPPIREVPVRIEQPSRFCGRYRDPDSGTELIVAGGEGGLYLEDARKARLIPEGDRLFLIESMGAALAFADESDGRFRRVELVGNLPGPSPVWLRSDPKPAAEGGVQ